MILKEGEFPFGPPVCQLVPMATDHAEFVIALRQDPQVGRFLNPGANTVDQQMAWITRQRIDRASRDLNLVIQRHGQSIGTAALLNLTSSATGLATAEYGRFALLNSPAARLLALPAHWMVLRYGVEVLGVDTITWAVREDNQTVVSFHESFGYTGRVYHSASPDLPEGTGYFSYTLDRPTFDQCTQTHQTVLTALLR
jgi:RimJ/RimL family protein N-acetyltransferase